MCVFLCFCIWFFDGDESDCRKRSRWWRPIQLWARSTWRPLRKPRGSSEASLLTRTALLSCFALRKFCAYFLSVYVKISRIGGGFIMLRYLYLFGFILNELVMIWERLVLCWWSDDYIYHDLVIDQAACGEMHHLTDALMILQCGNGITRENCFLIFKYLTRWWINIVDL